MRARGRRSRRRLIDTTVLENALRASGHRISVTRRLVLMVLAAVDRPVTAEEIASGGEGRVPPSDLSSIYRNLEMLEREGLVYHLHPGHGPRHYRLAGSPADEPYYVVCERCKRFDTVDFSDLDDVRAAISHRVGYRANLTHFPIVGLCPACTGAAVGPSPRQRGTPASRR